MTTTLLIILIALLILLVAIFINRTYYLQKQISDLLIALYGETDEDFGAIGNMDIELHDLASSTADEITKLEKRLTALEKPIKKLKVK
jgi:hypothetical protein